jgi:hypothetical protein
MLKSLFFSKGVEATERLENQKVLHVTDLGVVNIVS